VTFLSCTSTSRFVPRTPLLIMCVYQHEQVTFFSCSRTSVTIPRTSLLMQTFQHVQVTSISSGLTSLCTPWTIDSHSTIPLLPSGLLKPQNHRFARRRKGSSSSHDSFSSFQHSRAPRWVARERCSIHITQRTRRRQQPCCSLGLPRPTDVPSSLYFSGTRRSISEPELLEGPAGF